MIDEGAPPSLRPPPPGPLSPPLPRSPRARRCAASGREGPSSFLLLPFAQRAPLMDELTEGAQAWLTQLDEQRARVEALPVVRGAVQVICGDKPNENRVTACITCCWQPSRRSFKQVVVNCSLERNNAYASSVHCTPSVACETVTSC